MQYRNSILEFLKGEMHIMTAERINELSECWDSEQRWNPASKRWRATLNQEEKKLLEKWDNSHEELLKNRGYRMQG